jgi:DNA polymerase elongation subunit (family B)
MAAYLFRHYHTPIYIHNNAEAITMEREAYKGGRCECFVIGDLSGQPFYIVDVNSLYPYVMKAYKLPHKYCELSHRTTVKKLGQMLNNHAVVARVRIETDEPVYAIKTGRTIFPVGTFDTTLCTPELQYAIDHNHIVKVYDAVEYEQANLFSSYVTTMLVLRNECKANGNKAYAELVKVLMNSLYGKFGQKAEDWIRIGAAPGEPDREEMILHEPPKRPTRLRYLLGEVFELKRYGEAFNSFPAIAAHVTAYARLYLWELMQACGKGNYVYCDTDSLMVTDVGLDNLSSYMSATELGKLKLEKTVESLVIRGLKDYTADEKVVIKGIRKTAHKVSDGVYTQEQWPTFKGLFKSSDANRYVVKNVTKHLTREYTKGTVGTDGIVTPFVL